MREKTCQVEDVEQIWVSSYTKHSLCDNANDLRLFRSFQGQLELINDFNHFIRVDSYHKIWVNHKYWRVKTHGKQVDVQLELTMTDCLKILSWILHMTLSLIDLFGLPRANFWASLQPMPGVWILILFRLINNKSFNSKCKT